MRYEIKFPIFFDKINILNQWLDSLRAVKLHHENRLVNSIYYDDDDYNCAIDNINGISDRKKYRIRWYNNNKKKFQYEIKIKKNKLSNKIIFEPKNPINFENYNKLFEINSSNFDLQNKNLKYINCYNLKPNLKISYIRKYLIYENKIRITVDENLNFTNFHKNNLHKVKKDNINILEIKFDESNYNEALYLIKNCYFTPKRFSKYLRGLALHGLANYL